MNKRYMDCIPQLRAAAKRHGVEALANPILDNILFATCTGSSKPENHHYGEGGLQYHTNEVWVLAATNYDLLGMEDTVPLSAVYLAVLYHDFGKIFDYRLQYVPTIFLDRQPLEYETTSHWTLINHVNRSAIIWHNKATEQNYDPYWREEILHAILAHHAEHGSSVLPKTRLAWLLHLCDCLSAWNNQCSTRDAKR